jgi:hypothetical protein
MRDANLGHFCLPCGGWHLRTRADTQTHRHTFAHTRYMHVTLCAYMGMYGYVWIGPRAEADVEAEGGFGKGKFERRYPGGEGRRK